jgi:hypothetical protein
MQTKIPLQVHHGIGASIVEYQKKWFLKVELDSLLMFD